MSGREKEIDDVIGREAGYVNHPLDRGAATKYGITQRVYTMWRAAHKLGYKDVQELTKDEARAIYREYYWEPARCDILPEEIRAIHFDASVNHGVRRAIMLLQRACMVEEDGVLGKQTLAAVAAISAPLLVARYVSARYRFYGEIIRRDRTQLAFIAGWMGRMEEFS